ncbi:MAG: class I SAM-dependent methyltransferase [Candidatus Eremiobacteraeota bacterium]|nr:class I SAM-dependent methyltransferase [Candidatus Eremiobacteraeota bacterium]
MSGKRSGQRFDAENGVTTEAMLFLGQLDPEAIGDAIADATHYEPVPVADFHALISAVPEPLQRMRFIDAGSGMGRAVMLASRYSFLQIVGIEVSPALHEVAKENLTAWRAQSDLACSDIRLVRADASAYAYPPGDLLLFLYNPFGARTVARTLERVLTTRANGDRLFVVYHTPEHALAAQNSTFELVTEMRAGRVYRVKSARSSSSMRSGSTGCAK